MHARNCNYNMLVLQNLAVVSSARFSAPREGSVMTTDEQEQFEQLIDDEDFAPGLTRGAVLQRGAAAGAAMWGVSTLFGPGAAFASTQARALTPTFYQWIYGLYPEIPDAI